jgi:transposase
MIDLRKRVFSMCGTNKNLKKIDIVKHFELEGFKRSTIYDTIKRYENGLPIEDRPRSGRPPYFDNKKLKRLQYAAENRIGVTQRKLSTKFGVTQPAIHYNLKKLGLKYYKRQKTPKYTTKQLQQISKKCGNIRRRLTTKHTFIIVDDEKYFTFTNDDMPQNTGFYSSNKERVPDDVKYKAKEKYSKKVLVWLSISAKGISEPFIGTVKGPAINANVYINKCLGKLLAFIETYHSHDDYVFWPDLATSHYANDTTQWLLRHQIKFIPKQVNPPKVPKARPIEDFWSILANKVYEGGWEATTELQLKQRIRKKIKEIDMNVVNNMMNTIRTKLRKIEKSGPFAII